MLYLRERLRYATRLAKLGWLLGDDDQRLAEELVEFAEQLGIELHTCCLQSEMPDWDPCELAAIQELHIAAGHKTVYATSCWERPCQDLV
jgi:hypothetical protein